MSFSKTQDAVLVHLHQHGELPKEINGKPYRSTTTQALVNRNAIRPGKDRAYELTDAGLQRVQSSAVRENMDNPRPNRYVMHWWDNSWRATFDIGQADYEYWDKALRCEVEGLEIAGLFLKPLGSKKAAWVFGQMPKITCDDEYTQQKLNDWANRWHTELLLGYEAAVNRGDSYVVVNPDESVTNVAPHVVKPLVNEQDWSQLVGYQITQTYAHPTRFGAYQTIDDEYTSRGRLRVIKRNGQTVKTDRYRAMLPLAPVIQIANNISANERHGHAEGEALLKALMIYGEMISSSAEGVVKQGRPIPVFSRMGDVAAIDKFIEMYGEEKTRTLPDGTVETWTEIQLSGGDVVVLGGTGELQQVQPDQFTSDAVAMLQILFYLFTQHTEIPEFVWGAAIQGSRASAETQMPPFTKWAEKEQGRAEKWLIPLLQVVLAIMALVDPKIKANQDVNLKWAPLTTSDDKLTLESIKVALSLGGFDKKDLVPYYPLDIDNPDEIIAHMEAMEEENRRRANGEDEPFVNTPQNNTDNNSPMDDSEEEEPEEATESILSKQLKEAAHTGATVAFEIPLDTATNLALATRQSGIEAVAPEDMHITLAYIGEITAIEDNREAIEAALQSFVSTSPNLEGAIRGVGRFNASDTSDGQDVIYASFDSPDLPEFRQGLVEAIEGTGVEISRAHGFTPHITLAYVDKKTAMPNLVLGNIPLRFDEIVLAWGDERKAFKLKQEDVELVAELA